MRVGETLSLGLHIWGFFFTFQKGRRHFFEKKYVGDMSLENPDSGHTVVPRKLEQHLFWYKNLNLKSFLPKNTSLTPCGIITNQSINSKHLQNNPKTRNQI